MKTRILKVDKLFISLEFESRRDRDRFYDYLQTLEVK